MATSGSAAVDTDPTGLGPEVKRYRGKGAAGGDFCFWVVPGVLIPMGFFSVGLYFTLRDYAQSGPSGAGQPWFIAAAFLLLPFAFITFRRFRTAGKAVVVHKNGLQLINIKGGSLRLRWAEIHAIHTYGTRYQLFGSPVIDRYGLAIETAGGRRIEVPDRIEDLGELAETIRLRIDPFVKPDLYNRLAGGERVAFGPVTLDRKGLQIGRRTWTWLDLDQLKISGGSLMIESGRNRVTVPVEGIPNASLLLEIAARYGSGDRKT
jgi:hypothetical protein